MENKIIDIPYIKKCIEEAVDKIDGNKINSVSLFGSYSKGTAKASSDVDLFVDVNDDFSLFDFAGLQMELKKR